MACGSGVEDRARLGYKGIFLTRQIQIWDDHEPFLKRGVPAVDIIDLAGYSKELLAHAAGHAGQNQPAQFGDCRLRDPRIRRRSSEALKTPSILR